MEMRRPDFLSVMHVVSNMRESDRSEIFALRWNDSPLDLVADCTWSHMSWVAHLDEPIAVVGASPIHPGAWNVYAFATDRFREIAFDLTKFIRRVIIETLVCMGAHHAQCYSIEGHDDAHRWLEMLGATFVPVPFYGRNGESFRLYMWTRECATVNRILRKKQESAKRSGNERSRLDEAASTNNSLNLRQTTTRAPKTTI